MIVALLHAMNNSKNEFKIGQVSAKVNNMQHKLKICDKNLTIILLNIRSLRNKLIELELYIENLDLKPHIIIITESWLKEEEIPFFNLKGFQSIGNCRQNVRGGGIIIFIKDDIKFNILKNVQFSKSHLIMLKLSDLNMKVAGYYRSPSTKFDEFIEILENTLDKTDNLTCFGDSNFDLLKQNDSNVQKYINTITNNGYNILNTTDRDNYTYCEDKNGKKTYQYFRSHFL